MPRDQSELNGATHFYENGLEKQASSSFLTDAQRSALDTALANKQTSPSGAAKANGRLVKAHSLGKANSLGTPREGSRASFDLHHDRRGRGRGAKAAGRVKKGGAGGKYTWGALLSSGLEGTPPPVLDRNDPNYESADDQEAEKMTSLQSQQVKAYKQAVDSLIDEYFNSGDLQEASTTLQELDESGYNHFFVKKVVTRAMDKHNHEREMASILLSALHGEVISTAQMQKGFRKLLLAAPDLKLDVPDAAEQIAIFVARAVVDDVLPPAFVEDIPGDAEAEMGAIKMRCLELLHDPKCQQKLADVWGSGAGLVLDETRAAMGRILKDYLASGDAKEAEKGLQALAVSFFHHEFVRQAVSNAMHNAPKQASILHLLQVLTGSGIVSSNQLAKGFQRVADNLEKDAASTRERFEAIVADACAAGWLDAAFQEGYLGSQAAASGGSLPTPETQAYKHAVVDMVKEYFSSADCSEVATALEELGKPELQHIFVKQAVLLALDRKNHEREMVSVLLATLCPKPLSEGKLSDGFTALMLACEDLELDLPDASYCIALFLGRAIVDEVLPPAFLTGVLSRMSDDSLGVHIVQTVRNMLSARHAAERLQRCWASPFAFSIDHLRQSFQALLTEYLVSGDYQEASNCLRALDAPHYHHELTKRALLKAFEKPDKADQLLGLIGKLTDSGQISQTQVDIGFNRVEADLADIDLDHPNARQLFASFKSRAVSAGWLHPEPASSAAHVA